MNRGAAFAALAIAAVGFALPAAPAWVELAAVAVNEFRRRPDRTEFVRAHAYVERGRLRARVLRGQGSHMIGTLRHTNALIRVEADSAGFAAGDEVRVIPLALGTEGLPLATLEDHGRAAAEHPAGTTQRQ